MELMLNNKLQTFLPLQTFRAQWGLPESFTLAYFEPKNWEGLGSVEGAGQALFSVKQRTVQAVPAWVTLARLTIIAEELTYAFRTELAAANTQIGLRPAEFDFAVSGFYDVLHAVAFNLIQLGLDYQQDLTLIRENFDFLKVYYTWLNESVGIFAATHTFEHTDTQFKVRVVYNAYGRVGFEVQVAGKIYYVADMSLACPAASYMRDLCAEVAEALCRALTD